MELSLYALIISSWLVKGYLMLFVYPAYACPQTRKRMITTYSRNLGTPNAQPTLYPLLLTVAGLPSPDTRSSGTGGLSPVIGAEKYLVQIDSLRSLPKTNPLQ